MNNEARTGTIDDHAVEERDMSRGPGLETLQDLMDSIPDLVEYFYNDTLSPHSKGRPQLSPVPIEHTNWRDEQRGWRESAILFDQSHHMPELFISGPDALKLLMWIGVNSFNNFGPGRAKQFVACNRQGQVIGECVLYCLAEDSFELVSGMTILNWVEYNAQAGGYDVKIVRDHQTSDNPTGGRVRFRFGLDGPRARDTFQDAVEGDAPEVRFFRTARVRIAGCDVLALGHGMAGHHGVELSGQFADGPAVRAAIIEAGRRHGLIQGGSRTYFTTASESGWMSYPLPAIYSAEDMRGFRTWLSATGWEASSQLGGSYRARNIEDYYVTPWDLGLEKIVKFDHDFVGRDALEEMAQQPRRTKVTLVWHKEDITRIFESWFKPGIPYKYIDLPSATYSFQLNDQVLAEDGHLIGRSTSCGYTINERELLSLAMIDRSHAEPGTQVQILWGEPHGGSRKPQVEHHQQTLVRATVAPAPYAQVARQMKGQ